MSYALNSLIQILEQDQYHLYLDCKLQIKSFLEQACLLRDSLPTNTFWIDADLERRITDVAHKAEDSIELYITNQILLPVPDEVSQLDLTDLLEEVASILIDVFVATIMSPLGGDCIIQDLSQLTNPVPDRKYDLVGREQDFQTLKERLIQGPSQLQVIPLYGVAGVGKMTLAQSLYKDSLIGSHFDICAWINAPVQSNVRSHLLRILEGLRKLTNEMYWQDDGQLGVNLHNALKYRKYFIVIHDLGSIETWNILRRFFPKDNVGGRILLTITERKMGDNFGYIQGHEEAKKYGNVEPHKLDILAPNESWVLFCQKVFGQEHCPDELKSIGEHIVSICRGVPLIISLVGRMFSYVSTLGNKLELWESVAGKLSQASEYNSRDFYVHVSAMSYALLPYYLKPCFLYIGCFPENHEIQASKLIKLWIAEGFVEQTAESSPEDHAEVYLKILADRNLISLSREGPNGKVNFIHSHRALKIFCVQHSHKTNFQLCIKLDGHNILQYAKIMRRVSVHPSSLLGDRIEIQSPARSFLTIGRASPCLARVFLQLRLLRVLDVFQIEFHQFPTQIPQLVLLRYLAISCHSNLPASISRLQNLQTLVIRRLPSFRAFSLPCELWEMAKLRHVECKETFVWYYPENGTRVVQGKLQLLSNVQICAVTNEFIGSIPNIRKLGIFCNMEMHTTIDLSCLLKLEILKCSSDWSLASRNSLSYLTFPTFLRKLSLYLCRIPWGFMEVVGSLPSLEQLKLQKSDFLGIDSGSAEPEWGPIEGEFPRLLSLVMVDLNLVHWKAHATHFPRLQQLIIRNCCAMVEIHLDIGGIQTLELISVNKRSTPSLLASAMRISEEQKSRGNELLQVRLTGI